MWALCLMLSNRAVFQRETKVQKKKKNTRNKYKSLIKNNNDMQDIVDVSNKLSRHNMNSIREQ